MPILTLIALFLLAIGGVGLAWSYRRMKRLAATQAAWLTLLRLEPLLGLAVVMGAFLFAFFCFNGRELLRVALLIALAAALCTSFGTWNRAKASAPAEARRPIAVFASSNALLLCGAIAAATGIYLAFTA